jgi:hypothetical protein
MQTKTTTTTPAPKPDAQPVQAVSSTPGPWEKRHLRVQKEGNYIADCDAGYLFSDEEKHANARLIAAAPALLAALEKIETNAAESPEWIRRVTGAALQLARGKTK